MKGPVKYVHCVYTVLLQEMGGYFIVNGIEKVIRMLILPRRNYVSMLYLPSFSSSVGM